MDLEKIHTERIEMTTYESEDYFDAVPFMLEDEELDLDRYYDPHPFVPSDKENVQPVVKKYLISRLMA